MNEVTFDTLLACFQKAREELYRYCKERMADPLPTDFVCRLYGNYSGQEDAVRCLIESGVPPIIDLAVTGMRGESPVVWLNPTSYPAICDMSDSWNFESGLGPFKIVGIMVPEEIWERVSGKNFTLSDLRRAQMIRDTGARNQQ